MMRGGLYVSALHPNKKPNGSPYMSVFQMQFERIHAYVDGKAFYPSNTKKVPVTTVRKGSRARQSSCRGLMRV